MGRGLLHAAAAVPADAAVPVESLVEGASAPSCSRPLASRERSAASAHRSSFRSGGARRARARGHKVRGARTVGRGGGEVDGFLLLPLLAFLLLLLLIRAIRRALIKPESIMLAGYFRRWPFSAVLH